MKNEKCSCCGVVRKQTTTPTVEGYDLTRRLSHPKFVYEASLWLEPQANVGAGIWRNSNFAGAQGDAASLEKPQRCGLPRSWPPPRSSTKSDLWLQYQELGGRPDDASPPLWPARLCPAIPQRPTEEILCTCRTLVPRRDMSPIHPGQYRKTN